MSRYTQTVESIQESHFDFRDYSNFDKTVISKKRVEAFFECMPKHIQQLIEEEFAANKALWEADKEAYFITSMRGPRDNFMKDIEARRKPWMDYAPAFVTRTFYRLRSYWNRITKESKYFKWYYPLVYWFDVKCQMFIDIYTHVRYGYVQKNIWNFDFDIARLLVTRLLLVKKMKRHSYVTNREATDVLYEETNDTNSHVAYTDEEWEEIMNRVIFGFMLDETDAFDFNDSQRSLPNASYWKIVRAIAKEQEEGRKLFAKHFYQFGD